MLRLIAAFVLLAVSATAQPAAETAERAAERLRAAASMLELAQTKRDRVSALTETVQAYEDGLIAMRAGLRQAAIRETTLIAQLDAKSVEVGRLLGVLQTIERAPTPLLLLHPSGALGTARGGMLTADLTPSLQSEVESLRAQLSEVAILRTLQDRATDTLQDGLEGAQAARSELGKAISDRTDLPRRFVGDQIQMQLLVASTETLDAFAKGLAENVPSGPATANQILDKGNLAIPVRGQLLRRANAPDAAGVTRPGVIIAAPPRAIVTSSGAATVLFAGPLLDYGNVVILEPAADVMFIYAGLGEVYAAPGDVISEGAPLGLLGGEQAVVDDFLTQSDEVSVSNATETLYLEVRDGQTPVDPGDWFALE